MTQEILLLILILILISLVVTCMVWLEVINLIYDTFNVSERAAGYILILSLILAPFAVGIGIILFPLYLAIWFILFKINTRR